MKFIDEVEIRVKAGDGGNGAIAFRREKFVPLGGPSGGDGGRGGSVVLVGDSGLSTLMDLRYRREIEARSGENGRGRDQYGRGGKDEKVRVPLGTQIFDNDTGALVADMKEHGEEIVVARGGDGGRGNIHFATPYDKAPRKAEDGHPGEARDLRLELKLLADVGVVGFPNVGKSTFIAAVSRAKPKIADYPFTTLTPNLGVASLGDDRSFVIADIPGIIEGAAEGAGLGLRFLKHIERTRVLFHVVTLDPDPERELMRDFDLLLKELEHFDAVLRTRPMVVAVSKTDLPEVSAVVDEAREAFKARGIELLSFSAATREGVDDVLLALEKTLRANPLYNKPKDRPRLTKADRPANHPAQGFAVHPDPEDVD